MILSQIAFAYPLLCAWCALKEFGLPLSSVSLRSRNAANMCLEALCGGNSAYISACLRRSCVVIADPFYISAVFSLALVATPHDHQCRSPSQRTYNRPVFTVVSMLSYALARQVQLAMSIVPHTTRGRYSGKPHEVHTEA